MRRIFKTLSYSPIRSGLKEAFYNSKAGNVLTSHKLQIWPGYATEVQAYEGGVLLEVI